MSIITTKEDEKWLRQGIVKELIISYDYSKNEAVSAFEDSPLSDMLQTDPGYVFHYDTRYWADFIAEMNREYRVIVHKTEPKTAQALGQVFAKA